MFDRIHAKNVNLCNSFRVKRHLQEVIFEVEIQASDEIYFECDLPTWTFTWGGVNEWIAEIHLDGTVWLKAPTELCLRMVFFGWIRNLPLIGGFLGKTVAGAPGFDAYFFPDNWSMIVMHTTTTFREDDQP